MYAPAWKWEWNLNTVVILLGFAGGLVAWGGTWNDVRNGRAINEGRIAAVEVRVTANELLLRKVDNHEQRLLYIEKGASDTASSMKALEGTLNDLASDMKVTREILQRIEASQKASINDGLDKG